MFFRPGILRASTSIYQKTLRTFLSDEFKCITEWQSRLSAPFMQKVKIETFYFDIEQTLQQKGKASSIDIDIFVNRIEKADETLVDEMADLLHKHRLTEETTHTLDSTQHAAVRHLVDSDNINELINILDDRLSYGVFLDSYTASYTLDYLIKKRDFVAAAKIGVQLMLQEDFDNELSRVLSLYSFYKFLEKPDVFYPLIDKVETDDSEVVKVRVKFLRNEFFDDHFDLKNHFQLVGKSFYLIGLKYNDDFGRNLQLLGSILYEKYDKALEILNSKTVFNKDVITKVLEHLETNATATEEKNEKLEIVKKNLTKLSTAENLNVTNFEKYIEDMVKNVVSKTESVEIAQQKKNYLKWNVIREEKLKEELHRLNRTKRLKEIEKLNEEMAKEEQKLWFFDNEDQIDLQIDSKTDKSSKIGKKQKSKDIDDDYVPPEIIRQKR